MLTNEEIFTKIEAYLLTEKRVAKNTFSAYRQDMRQFDLFLADQELHLSAVTRAHLSRFWLQLKEQSISARSIARKISTIRMIFTYAHERLGFENIADNIPVPKIEQRLPQFLTEAEIEKLLSVASSDTSELGKRNCLILYLLYGSGMRISELTHLTIPGIRFDIGIITIQGKGGKERMVPMPQSTMEMLRDYTQTMVQRMKEADDKNPDYLFPVVYRNKIKPISRQSCWIIMQHLCRKAGIYQPVSPHMLRHSFATHFMKNGADIRSLQLLLGHQNVTTMQIYTHVETGHLRTVYDKKHPRS